jgi:hypothetical protein
VDDDERRPDWLPQDGDRVRVLASGHLGTIMRRIQTEWGLLCDVAYVGTSHRKPHVAAELERLDGDVGDR